MSEIKINLVKTSYGFSNLVFSDKPTEQMLAELKQNGWVYSRRQNRWYPGKTTGRNLAEIEKFAVEFKNKFNPETQNEVVKEPHVVSLSELSAEELREGMKYALNEVAQPLPKIDFTRENYNKLFPYSKIDTPIETVKIGAHQFEKLEEKDRKKLLQAVHDVLSNPDVIINEEKKSVFGDTENSHIYAKSYVINENTKAVQSVVVNIEDEYVSISTHKRDISNVVNKIKKPDQLLFAAAKVRLLAERLTNEKSVTVNPNRENEYVIPPQANITQPQEKSSEIPENHKTSFEKFTTVTTKSGIKSIREQCRKILEKSDNEITREDKAILSQYEGAGGINEENRTNAGILNEFYTPNNLVEKVWQIADAYAPNAVTVLEPSAGVGKFANNRPNNIFTMHELDETSARINKILHPDANVIQGAYQKQFFDENGIAINKNYVLPQYDIVIGNPPYGEYLSEWKGKGEGKEFDRYEEYFISRGLDALKDENSVMAFVVPSGFLNSSNDKIKKLIAEKGELIDAYRLPEGTFPTTKVGTDIILMRSWKKEKNKLQKNWDDHSFTISEALIAEQKGHADLLSDNLWFKQHPEKILGEVKTRTNRFGKVEEYVAVHEGLTVQDELNKIDGMLHHVESPLSVDTVETASHFTDADKAVIQNKDISTEEKKVIPFIELAKVEMKKTPKTVFETEYAKEQNLETGISGLSARDFKYRWDRKTVINSETKEIIFCAGKNILAKIDSQGIFKKFYSDEKYKKLTPATKENLDVYLKSFETDAQNIAEQFLGTFENKYYFKDIKNSISNLFVYNPVTKNQSEISAYNSYVCATGIDIESNEELENSYDYYDAKHQRKIPLFYATAQSLYPKDRKIKIENIISDNKKILESINEDIESIDFDEKTMSYSELDNAWNERQNLKINAMLKFSNLNHDEFFETAKAYYQNQKEKIKELRIDTSSKRIKAEDANLIFEEIIKNPLDGEKIFKAGASFVSYVKNNSGYDVLIDDKRALFIDESQKQLSTYNNYFVTKELLNAFKEKFNGEINISDIPYTEENISLNKIIAEKNSSVAKNKTGTEIAEFFISSISSNETEIKKQIGLEVKIVSAGIISDVFIDDMNHKAFEFNKQNNLLKIYQPCFDREMIPGIEKAFIEKFHDLSIDKDITVENVRYNDHNGQTVVLNARPQRFIPEKEQLMTAQTCTEQTGILKSADFGKLLAIIIMLIHQNLLLKNLKN